MTTWKHGVLLWTSQRDLNLNDLPETATTAPSLCKKEEEQSAGCTPLRQLVPHPKGVWVFSARPVGQQGKKRNTQQVDPLRRLPHPKGVDVGTTVGQQGEHLRNFFFFFFAHVDEYQRATCGNSVSSGMQAIQRRGHAHGLPPAVR